MPAQLAAATRLRCLRIGFGTRILLSDVDTLSAMRSLTFLSVQVHLMLNEKTTGWMALQSHIAPLPGAEGLYTGGVHVCCCCAVSTWFRARSANKPSHDACHAGPVLHPVGASGMCVWSGASQALILMLASFMRCIFLLVAFCCHDVECCAACMCATPALVATHGLLPCFAAGPQPDSRAQGAVWREGSLGHCSHIPCRCSGALGAHD